MDMLQYGKLRVELMRSRFVENGRLRHGAAFIGARPPRPVASLERAVAAAEAELGIAAVSPSRSRRTSPPPKQATVPGSRATIAKHLDRLRRMNNATEDDRATATHEAAHCVAAFVLGAEVLYARAGGAVSPTEPRGLALIHNGYLGVVDRATIGVAGAVAERVLSGKAGAQPSPADITVATRGVLDENEPLVLRDAFAAAWRIVRQHAAFIGELRDELLGVPSMSAADLESWRLRFVGSLDRR